jgi:hypothetical protein
VCLWNGLRARQWVEGEEVASVREMAAKFDHLPPAHPSHTVRFLHGDHQFQEQCPTIFAKLMGAVVSAARAWGVLADATAPRVRVIEHHCYSKGGNLNEKEHFDEGSLVTIDVRLSQVGAFEGGEFKTWECSGEMRPWPLEALGDAVLFLSHKYHSVTPLRSGTRNVLIMETWLGETCSKSHRCLRPFGCGENEAEEEAAGFVDLLNLDDL